MTTNSIAGRQMVSGLVTAVVVLFADQLVKYVVTGPLGLDQVGDVRAIVPVFALRFVGNEGVSLGLLRADSPVMRWALVALTAGIALAVLVWMSRERNRADRIALGFVQGGALGNILDRMRLGYVVDYADLHFGEWRPFYIFNLGDAAITVGVLVLLARALLMREKPKRVSVENNDA